MQLLQLKLKLNRAWKGEKKKKTTTTYEPALKLHEWHTNQNIPAVGHEQVRSQIRPYHSSSTPAGLPRPSKQGKGGNADFDDFAQQGTQLLWAKWCLTSSRQIAPCLRALSRDLGACVYVSQ